MPRYEDGYPARGEKYPYSRRDRTEVGGPPPHDREQLLLTYEPEETTQSSRSQADKLQLIKADSQLRSQPPPYASSRDGYHKERFFDYSDSEDDRARSSSRRAKNSNGNNPFTDSIAGLGVGVLGAIVGGFAGRKAANLTNGRPRRRGVYDDDDADDDNDSEYKRNQLIGTIVGATVGALTANAVEKRIERRRARDESRHEGRRSRAPEYDMDRSRGQHRDRYHDASSRDEDSRHGLRRETVSRSRSWNTVEEWVLDVANSDGGGRPEE